MKRSTYLIELLSVSAILCVTMCSCENRRHLDWHFVVSETYQGFLIVRFDYPGGMDAQESGSSLTVKFSNEGVAYSSLNYSNMVPSIGTDRCSDTAGRMIPMMVHGADHSPAPPRALCGGTSMNLRVRGQEFSFYIVWVGDPVHYASYRNTAEYDRELRAFLREGFSVPYEIERDTPTNAAVVP
jgi:hypothetical protein